MTPAALALLVGLVEEAVKVAPAIASEFRTIFTKTDPTPQDWLDMKATVQSESFASLVPDAKLS